MAGPQASDLNSHYRRLEAAWTVSDRSESYGRLVVPNGNSSEPFHRWFHLKEAYSSQLLDQLFTDSSFKPTAGFRLYDPYSGSGTTLISAVDIAGRYMTSVEVYGVERNPFLWELSRAKLAGRLHGQSLVAGLEAALAEIKSHSLEFDADDLEMPAQSTLRNEVYFPRSHVEELVAIRKIIDRAAIEPCRSILRVCLAACVEPSGRLRRDGRALRFMERRKPRRPLEVFEERLRLVTADLSSSASLEAQGDVFFGDGRHLPGLSADGTFDWIVFSPPYPNNIDYTEIYKTESWILGCYSTSEDMRKQRLSTVRSHPSLRFNQGNLYESATYADAIDAIVQPVVAAVPADKYAVGRKEMIPGYVDDMIQTLAVCRSLVAEDGTLAYIVGNSAHGNDDQAFVIAADVLIGAVAEQVGWRVAEVRVARKLTRRRANSPYLRESVVILKPQ
ncbi:SAM-dependent DNA methyltransferase [Nonomuraea turkmeniaca]|uniref:SAM-dependent DNA methyltransferase n=1 Tax=Nonomuraea turkmeniaca TaxID=103838 RepID=A0A5S4F7N9_9ACTN|nr:type I restriction-modification system subunit M [Nonomuraea turkmeniaca]TMR12366.1 SAM-dependent DNA methyltransferase [Nonomuraea turkmeniaca]